MCKKDVSYRVNPTKGYPQMEMTMQTNIVEQVRKAKQQIQEGRQTLATLVDNIGRDELLALLLGDESGVEDIALPDKASVTANVERSATASRSPRIVNGRPSLPWAMQLILKDAGKSLSTDEVFAGLEERKWVPDSKNPRTYVSRILSGNPRIFTRDETRGRGHYQLPNGFEVPELPAKMAKKSNGGTLHVKETSKVAKAKTSRPAGPAVIELLKHTRKDISITDVVKATGLPAKSVQGVVMSLIRESALKKTGKVNESGKKLFAVDRDAFNTYVKKSEAAAN